MKISVITSPFGDLPPNAIGAVEKLFHQLAYEWVKNGHSVSFLCSGGGDNSQIKYIRLGKYSRTGHTLTDLPFDLLYSIKAVIAAPRCDILLCNTFWSPIIAPLFRWKYKCLIYGVHRFPKNQFWLYPFVHAFICVSSAVAKALKERIGTKRLVSVINNPVDLSIFQKQLSSTRSDRNFTVVFSGRVHPEKGVDLLFKALEILAREFRECKMAIRIIGPTERGKGGGGDDYANLLNSLAPSVEKVWIGEIRDPRILAAEIKKGDCFVYPSVAEMGETFGVAPLEAMALGMPTVVSALDCFADFLKDGENGLVFNHRSPKPEEELCSALQRIYTDLSFATSLGNKASNSVKMFSVPIIAENYITEFHRVLEANS